jgi:Icc-related predicted phosphoesterase
MRLLCLSDIHGEVAGLSEILADSSGIDAIVVAGDITHLGGYAEAGAVLAPLQASGIRVLAVAGNMDGDGVRQLLGERGIDLHGRGITIGGVGFMGLQQWRQALPPLLMLPSRCWFPMPRRGTRK